MDTQKNRKRQPAGKGSASSGGRQQAKEQKSAQDVVYLAPKPFSRHRFALQLATVGAVVLALFLGLSVFFNIDLEKTTVSGMEKYTAQQIIDASGLLDGENLLTFSRPSAASRIIKALPYVKSVRFGIKLPDTVNIEIVELEVTYAAEADDGWYLLAADGRIVEKTEEPDKHPRILGIHLEAPKQGEKAVAREQAHSATDADGNIIPVTVTGAKRLQTALDIACYLEDNRVIGTVRIIDVEDMGNIALRYSDSQDGKQGYDVLLGNDTDLSGKISNMKQAIAQLGELGSGILDLSDPSRFTFEEIEEKDVP